MVDGTAADGERWAMGDGGHHHSCDEGRGKTGEWANRCGVGVTTGVTKKASHLPGRTRSPSRLPRTITLGAASAAGHITIAPDALRFAVRYEQDQRRTVLIAGNGEPVEGHVDAIGGILHLTNVTASSDDGSMAASMSLHADLRDTQPSTTIIENAGAPGSRVSLTAQTFDAEHDPIEHHWMIPGVGNWIGDHLDVALPIGRHAVILRAVDVHRSQGVTARWIEVNPSGT